MAENNHTIPNTGELIEKEIEEHEKTVYGGSMPAHNKQVLREMLRKEHKFWEWEARDFIPGKDDGEPPKGAQW